MTGTANVSAAERFGLDSPLLLRAGEATLFLAAVATTARPLRRLPVVTVQAPALLATREALRTGTAGSSGPASAACSRRPRSTPTSG